MLDQLTKTIAQAEEIYLRHLGSLDQIRREAEALRKGSTKQVLPGAVRLWIKGITHVPTGRHRRLRVYATAYYKRQQIVYSPLFLEHTKGNPKLLLDLVLHEMGHLFTHHFFDLRGHDWSWCSVGGVVGYAPVGGTSDDQRARYSSFAAHANTVVTERVKPIAKVSTVKPGSVQVLPSSTVARPVDRVWAFCDRHGMDYSRKAVINYLVGMGINRNTAQTQYGKWRKVNAWRFV